MNNLYRVMSIYSSYFSQCYSYAI